MQKLIVKNFLGIKDAEIKIDGLSILIGPQASGKSIIARLIFFFNEYLTNFTGPALVNNEHKKNYDKRKREEFYQIFPQYSWEKDNYRIEFSNGLHIVEIVSDENSSSIEIKTSPSVAKAFRDLKNNYKAWVSDTESAGQISISPTRALIEYTRRLEQVNNGALFVPAARSFYATIRDEIFSLLALDTKIDRIILQFGEFYESAKNRMEPRIRTRMRAESHYFSAIIKGRYQRDQGRDWILMDRGRIELGRASSGQQEAVPLLFAISRFPDKGRTLIIEEPEAHLFPESQVSILEYIVRQCVRHQTDVFFTTHSPYMLAALNNQIVRNTHVDPRTGIPPSKVHAYAIEDGDVRSIFSNETELVEASYIDNVSEKIQEQFYRYLNHEQEQETSEE